MRFASAVGLYDGGERTLMHTPHLASPPSSRPPSPQPLERSRPVQPPRDLIQRMSERLQAARCVHAVSHNTRPPHASASQRWGSGCEKRLRGQEAATRARCRFVGEGSVRVELSERPITLRDTFTTRVILLSGAVV